MAKKTAWLLAMLKGAELEVRDMNMMHADIYLITDFLPETVVRVAGKIDAMIVLNFFILISYEM